MGMTDPIADGLTKIRNASAARHPTVEVRFSSVFSHILDVLRQEGFIRAYRILGETPPQRVFRVYLKYGKKMPAIRSVVRVSTPGVRVYRKASELPRVLRGLGVAVVSTSDGIMTERDAYRRRIGGEVLCYVW